MFVCVNRGSSFALLGLFSLSSPSVFNTFYLHCKKRLSAEGRQRARSGRSDLTQIPEPTVALFALFCSLEPLFAIVALCFQHFLSTLQKKPACRRQGAKSRRSVPNPNSGADALTAPTVALLLSFALLGLFSLSSPFVFNTFYLHCKKTGMIQKFVSLP
jgi:hypothetical protein